MKRAVGWSLTWLALFLMAGFVLALARCGPVEDGGKGKGASKFVGGRVENSSKSVQPINAYYNWTEGKWPAQGKPKGAPSQLAPGEVTSGSKDADGVCLLDYPAKVTTTTLGLFGPVTTKGTRGRGECWKVSDNEMVLVQVVKSVNESRT